jgi:hypothetical protein
MEINRCTVCLQPTSNEYKFVLTFMENGINIAKSFCGTSCLKIWIESDLDKIHLNTLEDLE